MACSGGSSVAPDTCSYLEITASIGELLNNKRVKINFSHSMKQTTITTTDLLVSIESEYVIDFSWTASYSSPTTLDITLDVTTALQGKEELTVKLLNSKTFRTNNGGCVKPDKFKVSMKSSLASVAETAEAASGMTQYITMAGIVCTFAVLLVCGASLELIWSLLNTLQLISFLPLMIPFYPAHVRIMFQILEFSNMDFEILSNFFKRIISIDGLISDSYSDRFLENGIDSPLFLSNCASLIFSLGLSVLALSACIILYKLIR